MVAVADSDSYLKWGAATLAALPSGAAREVMLVRTRELPSPAQRASALRGTPFAADAVTVVPVAELASRVAELRPDAVLVATRGPQARVLLRELAALDPRPVLVTGLPGISIPATRKALFFRAQSDLFVVHSHHEVEEFRRLAAVHGWDHRIALAGLPFARAAHGAGGGGADLVFAVQSLVPASREDRRAVARMLIRAAEADASRRVVVKVRAVAGERQTHEETHPIPALIAQELAGRAAPGNLVISADAMSAALATAEGLVTVSSTAALEAIGRGVPVIALDTFGVAPELINPVFLDSGLLAGEEDVVARRFRHPDPAWRARHYFHPASDDDLVAQLEELVAARRAGALPARRPLPAAGGALRRRWQRERAFGRGAGPAGMLALALGHPARLAVVAARRVTLPVRRALAARRGQVTP